MPGQGRRKLTEGVLHDGQAPTQAPCVAAHDGKVWHIAGNPPRFEHKIYVTTA